MIDIKKFDGHTAGPWECLPFGGKLMARIAMGGTCYPLKREFQPPDAHLIAAAPELLAEVIRLRAVLGEIAEHFDTDWPSLCRRNVRVARQALKGGTA